MKRSHKWIVGIGTSLSLGIAAVVSAHPGPMGGGMGPGMMGGMQHGMQAGMAPGAMRGGMGPGAMGRDGTGPQARQQLMTLEERTAIQEKMRNAKTPEERQKVADATRTEMQKRAQEKGIALPEHHGMRGHMGAGPNAAPGAPATTEPAR
jgi:hypothetical protein